MDPTDKELREQLAEGPFPGSGFDERLRKRIEANLDRPARRSRPRDAWKFGSAAAVLILALALGIWQWTDSGSKSWVADQQGEPSAAAMMDSKVQAQVEEPLETAMLIGLRKDVDTPDGGSVSSYRTVLIAPQGEAKLAIAASGEGIVMPYKQSFWLLDGTDADGTSSSQNLIAYEAYNSKKLLDVPEPAPSREGLLSEKLLYVGHEYVAVSQEASKSITGSSSFSSQNSIGEFRFVQSLAQLSESLGTAYTPLTEPHTALEEAKSDDGVKLEVAKTGKEQWSLVRQTGRWNAVVYRGSSEFGALDTLTEEQLDADLPDAVARNNSLPIEWHEVRSLEPGAQDAFMSSNQQVLGIVLDRELKIYPYGRSDGASNALSLDLEPGESVIMVQWSVEQKYTEQWVAKVNEILHAATVARANNGE